MDKRSIVFVFVMTIALFLTNQFFTARAQQENQKTIKEATVEETKTQKDYDKRIVSISKLPIYPIYIYTNDESAAAHAYKINNQYATIAWRSNLPRTVYVKTAKGFEELQLSLKNQTEGSLALYSASGSTQLSSVYLPNVSTIDLQVVTLAEEKPEVFLAEYADHSLYFPKKAPSADALVFFEKNSQLILVGTYSPRNKRFLSLSEDPDANKITSYSYIDNTKKEPGSYYVLENDYQQVVFSTLGGSIVEINLPFQSKSDPKSVVRPIQLDETIAKKYGSNAYFPNFHYWAVNESGEQVKRSPKFGGYYPLLRRSIKTPTGAIEYVPPSRFSALNVLDGDSDDSALNYTVRRFSKTMIEFEATMRSKRIVKRYFFPESNVDAPYCMNLDISLDGNTTGLWLSSGVPEVELISNAATPSLQYRITKNAKPSIEKISLPKSSSTFSSLNPDWASNSNGFFGLILDPLSEGHPSGIKANLIPGQLMPARLTLVDKAYNAYPVDKYPGYEVLLPLSPNKSQSFRLFAGPLQRQILKRVDATYSNSSTGYNPDYLGVQTFHGWFSFISEPFAKLLFLLMRFFYTITHSWGISIILLTVALRIMLYPLNAWSLKSSTKMQEIQPKVASIQQRFRNDPKRAQMEIMQLYKEKKVNPFSGCLPILIQMPFLIGMFDLLKSTFELRGASFIPGWINNLTAPDVLFSWSYPLPFIGTQFHLLPFILGAVMFIQQRMMLKQKNTGEMTDQMRQQAAMGNIMTVVFTVIFYKMPSGLNIYFLSSTILALLQQKYVQRKMLGKTTAVANK